MTERSVEHRLGVPCIAQPSSSRSAPVMEASLAVCAPDTADRSHAPAIMNSVPISEREANAVAIPLEADIRIRTIRDPEADASKLFCHRPPWRPISQSSGIVSAASTCP